MPHEDEIIDNPHLENFNMPRSQEAEQAVLGSLILSPDQYGLIEGSLSARDFFYPSYGYIFEAIAELWRERKPIDPLLLRNKLQEKGNLEAAGGIAALDAVMDAVPSGEHAEHYARIVSDRSALRQLINLSFDQINKAVQPDAKPLDLLSEAETNVRQIASGNTREGVQKFDEVLQDTFHRLEMLSTNKSLLSGLATNFIELDNMLTGLHSDELIIVAGRPAMGKTTFALNVVRNVITREEADNVLLFTLEMSSENIARNILAAEALIRGSELRRSNIRQEDLNKLTDAAGIMAESPLWIDETPAISLPELRAKARRLHNKLLSQPQPDGQEPKGLSLIVIDYLQLMTASANAQRRSREQEIAEISRGLKALAKEMHIPIIALAQLSRKSEDRKDQRPILSDLRESGAIEQDADVVLMLHRPEYYNKEEPAGMAEVIIAKQRNGPTGTVQLSFRGEYFRFDNLSLEQGFAPGIGLEQA